MPAPNSIWKFYQSLWSQLSKDSLDSTEQSLLERNNQEKVSFRFQCASLSKVNNFHLNLIANFLISTDENVGRKLQWLHNLGKGELNANFLGKQYILEVSVS